MYLTTLFAANEAGEGQTKLNKIYSKILDTYKLHTTSTTRQSAYHIVITLLRIVNHCSPTRYHNTTCSTVVHSTTQEKIGYLNTPTINISHQHSIQVVTANWLSVHI